MLTGNNRVVVAMSGGVDSAVAAYLLKREGYDAVGVTMRLWDSEDGAINPSHQGCCSIDDIEDARLVCQTIGIPHYVVDARDTFRRDVIEKFVNEYRRGRTPHPCVSCNDRIKFDFLLRRAAAMDAQYVATGHYARIARDAQGRLQLLRGVDHSKDQSYVLFGLTEGLLNHVLLPVGHYSKESIRSLARQAKLHLAEKRDSQEICFIPSGDYRDFLSTQFKPEPGFFVDREGKVLGEHSGIEHFTIGQRRRLGLSTGQSLFVTRIDAQKKEVELGSSEDLMQKTAFVTSVAYLGEAPRGKIRVTAKIRYTGKDVGAWLEPGAGSAVLQFDDPQRAVTPGQAAVFYQDDRLIGGGVIDRLGEVQTEGFDMISTGTVLES